MKENKKRKVKVGINGIGRIGRAILRSNLRKNCFQIVVINDINPSTCNLAYQLNYDTIYGTLEGKFTADGEILSRGEDRIAVTHHRAIDDVPWEDHGVDIVIDASGVLDNVVRSRLITSRQGSVQHIVVTHSPEPVDFTMVLGANEEGLDRAKHKVISSSICDATALAPVMRLIRDNYGIKNGSVTTLHPWLNYQNLSDGPASSWSSPGKIYHHYALGRAAIGNMIPKPTSAVSATCKVVEGISEEIIGSFSYRTPTAIVGSADVTLNLSSKTDENSVREIFDEMEKTQAWKIVQNNEEPLVSLDFCKNEYSAVLDHRWTNIVGGDMLKLVLWYDNEWGYSSRVIDQIEYIMNP
ncbi:aldehyde dehydrogenase [bacterium]|nr:aldehyde dehydrogenase [bacterium]